MAWPERLYVARYPIEAVSVDGVVHAHEAYMSSPDLNDWNMNLCEGEEIGVYQLTQPMVVSSVNRTLREV